MKKLPILSAVALIVGQVWLIPIGEQALAKNVTSVRANEKITDFVFDKIGGISGNIGFDYNETQRQDIMLSEVYIASYKYEEYTTATVEERLEELGLDHVIDPDWADYVTLSMIPINYGEVGSRTLFMYDVPNFINNRPGVLYYALKTYELENPDEPVWYRGKIDYRACIRDAETGARYDCEGKTVGDTMVFTRVGSEETGLENAKTWGEEWQAELIGQLEGVEVELESWAGSESVKITWEDRLAYIERMSADAADVEAVLQKIASVKEEIVQKEWKLEHPEETDGETVTQPGSGGEVTLPSTGVSGSSSSTKPTGSNSGLVGESSTQVTQASESTVTVALATEQEATKDLGVTIAVDNGEETSTQVATAEAGEGNEDVSDNEATEDAEKREENYDETEVAVPDLNEEVGLVNKWWLWLLIGVILALAGAIYWWVRRAFRRKNS